MQQKIEIEKHKLEELLQQNEAQKKDLETMRQCAISLMGVLGLIDHKTNNLKQTIATGEENPMPSIIKAGGDLMVLLMQANGPKWAGGKTAEEKINQKFSFVKTLIPLIEKYK